LLNCLEAFVSNVVKYDRFQAIVSNVVKHDRLLRLPSLCGTYGREKYFGIFFQMSESRQFQVNSFHRMENNTDLDFNVLTFF
jgi:hypothetical protein